MRNRHTYTVAAALIWVVLLCSVPLAQAQATTNFDLPAESLADALRAIGSKTNTNILFDPPLVAGHRVPALKENLTTDQALTKLLAGTGIKHEFLNESTVVLAVANPEDIPAQSTSSATTSSSSAPAGDASQQEGKKPSSNGFRVAQLDRGEAASSTYQVAKEPTQGIQASDQLQEILVTAQKRTESLNKVPIEISVLGGEDLDKAPVQGITEALDQVPGVVAIAVNQGGGTQIGIRGVSASGPVFNGSSPIGYYLDGIPFGLVKTAIAPDSNAYDLDHVEVLRGPQGTLYGASALNGVVRVLTHDADLDNFELKGRLNGSYTDNGSGNYRGDMAINVPVVEGKLAVRAVVGYEDDSGWIDGPLGNHLNDDQLRNFRLKVNAQPTDPLSIGLSAWSTRNTFGAPAASSDGNRISSPIPEPESTYYDAYNSRIAYTFPVAVVSSSTSYLQYHDRIQLSIPGLAPPYNTALDSDIVSEEITASSLNTAPWRWSLGGFYRDGTDRVRQDIPTVFGINWGDGSKSYAVFGEIGERFFHDEFEWILGLRYFHDQVYSRQNQADFNDVDPANLYNKTEKFSATTPRAVLTWYPAAGLTAYISYSQGFRSGFPQYSSVAKTYPNFPSVEPDKLSNYEIGSKLELLDKRLFIDSAIYYMNWHNVQQTLNVPVNGTSVYVTAPVNGQAASGPGVDVSINVRPAEGLTVGVNASWNHLELDNAVYSGGVLIFNKGDRVNCSPEVTVGGSTEYTFRIGSSGYTGDISANVNYISAQYNRSLNAGGVAVLSSNSLVLGRATASLVSPHNWTASLFVDNFTNFSGVSGPPTNVGIPDWSPRIRPRTVGLQLNFKY